jgi:hypothetical protein
MTTKKKYLSLKAFLEQLKKKAHLAEWSLKTGVFDRRCELRAHPRADSLAHTACPIEFLGRMRRYDKRSLSEIGRGLGLTKRNRQAIIMAADKTTNYSRSLRQRLLQAVGLEEAE